MDEKTKELKKIEDLEELNEETSNTKKLDVINENEIMNNQEETINEDESDIDKLEEEEPLKDDSSKEKKKVSKNKVLIIVGVMVFVLLIVILLVIILLNNKKEEPITVDKEKIDYSDYGKVIYKSLNNGDLDNIIKKGLEDNNINVKTVTLLNIDLDSDDNQDLIVYASNNNNNNNKCLLKLNVKDDVSFEKSYKIDSKDSIGYLFSRKDEKFYWYINYSKKIYPIDGYSNSIEIDSKENMFNYDLITQKYKNEKILEYGLKYNFDKKLDIEELEEQAITNKDMLNNINTTVETSKKKLEDKEKEYNDKQQEEYEKSLKEREEKFIKDFPQEIVEKVLLVSVTNYFAEDTKDENKSFDISKFHDSSYDGEYQLTIKEAGKCEVVDYDKYWKCKNMTFESPNGVYSVTESLVKKVDLNYIVEVITIVNSDEKLLEIDGRKTSISEYPFLKVSNDLIK